MWDTCRLNRRCTSISVLCTDKTRPQLSQQPSGIQTNTALRLVRPGLVGH